MSEAVVQFVTGASGTGKSYVRGPVQLFEYWLPCTDRTIYTNLPFDYDAISKECVKHPEWAKRVVPIPQDVLDSWSRYESGPWDYFSGERVANYHLLLDEAQNVFADSAINPEMHEAHVSYLEKLQRWMGEHLRKNNGSLECLTQQEQMLAMTIRGIAACKRTMLPAAEGVIFGFRLADYAGLWSKLCGKKQGVVCEVVYSRKAGGAAMTAWQETRRNIYWLSAYNWRFYRSYNKPGTADSGVKPDREEWEILGWPTYLRVLLARYFVLITRAAALTAMAAVFVYMVYGVATSFAKVGKPNATTQPTLADDPETVAKLEAAGLAAVNAERLEWPIAARDLVRDLEAENAVQAAKNTVLESRVDGLKSSLRSMFSILQKQSQIVAITSRGAVQADGRLLKVGEVVTGGLFDGRTLERIDGDSVLFDGGLRVRPTMGANAEMAGMEFGVEGTEAGSGDAARMLPAATGEQLRRAAAAKLQAGRARSASSVRLEPVPERANLTTGRKPDQVFSGGGDGGRILPLPGPIPSGLSGGASRNRVADGGGRVSGQPPRGPVGAGASSPVVSGANGSSPVEPEPTLAD